MKNNETYAYIGIYDFDCKASDVSKLLKMQPDKFEEHPDSFWGLYSRLSRIEPIEKHIDDLLDLINPNKEAFMKIPRQWSIHLQCVGYYSEYNPSFSIPSTVLSDLAKLNINLDNDFYYLGDDEDSENKA